MEYSSIEDDMSKKFLGRRVRRETEQTLASGVYDFYEGHLLVHNHLFAVSIFNRRVVRLNTSQ